MIRRLTFSLVLCGGGAGGGVGRRTRSLEGEPLLQCVRSVMERTDHGDKPTENDRLFYSHRRYFGRHFYLLSRRHGIQVLPGPQERLHGSSDGEARGGVSPSHTRRRVQWAETLALLHEQHVPAATMTMRAQREHSHSRARFSSGWRETLQPLTEDRRFE